jgi:hypothetical protein
MPRKKQAGRYLRPCAVCLALLLCFSACWFSQTENFDLRPVSEKIIQIVKERDKDAFAAMMSPSVDFPESIAKMFGCMEGEIESVACTLLQKQAAGGRSNGKYFEDGLISLQITTNAAVYSMNITYEYYSEISAEDIGISAVSLYRDSADMELVFQFP